MTCRAAIVRPLPSVAPLTCPQCGKYLVRSATMREEIAEIAIDTPGILDFVCGGHQ